MTLFEAMRKAEKEGVKRIMRAEKENCTAEKRSNRWYIRPIPVNVADADSKDWELDRQPRPRRKADYI